MTMAWQAFGVTLRLAISTTVALGVIGLPLAYWLTFRPRRWTFLIESLVSLPIILPPTVLGFYLLMGLGPNGFIGRLWTDATGTPIPFTFAGILIGSVLFNMPFAVRPFMAGFASVDRQLIEASWSLGVSNFTTTRRIIFPLAWPGILTGLLLTFAHTIGEFGVVLMLGGNIPGVTQTLSVLIYDEVQALNYVSANKISLSLFLFAFTVLALLFAGSKRTKVP